MSASKKIPPEVQSILIDALIKTAFTCVIAYICFWLIFSLWSGLVTKLPYLFTINTSIFVLEILAAYQFCRYCKATPYDHLSLKQTVLTVLLILNGLHLGCNTAYIIYASEFTLTQIYTLRLIAVGFAATFGCTLGIVHLTGVVFAMMVTIPHMIASYWFQDTEANILALMNVLFLLFLYVITREMQRHYFLQFVSQYNLAQVHADSMEQLSKVDFVTKVNNRYYFLLGHAALWKNARKSKQPLSLICFSIQNLEAVRAQYDHKLADEIMAAVAFVISSSMPSPDAILGRYDQHQLMLSLANTDAAEANALANSICQKVREQVLFPQQLSVSVGCEVSAVSSKNFHNEGPDVIVTAAIEQLGSDNSVVSGTQVAAKL